MKSESKPDVSVIGLGYIGLPTAAVIARAGCRVRGIDVSQNVVDTINRGEIHIEEVDLDGLVQGAVGNGATIVTGGERLDGPGHFYAPTVLRDVDPGDPITNEEIFGPVAPLITFTDTDEMLERANDTEMGLTGYVFTEDLRRGLAVSERVQQGMIGLNRGLVSDPAAPFGGMKQSGLGREGSTDGIYEFMETQYIATEW